MTQYDKDNFYPRKWAGDTDRYGLALHCMMGTASAWGPVADALEGKLDLEAFDLPGHGRSTHWQSDGVIDYHTYVTRYAAGLITRPVDLIGHSFGATVALRIAVGAPHAIRSLTLIEPVLFAAAPDFMPEMDALHSSMATALADGRPDEAARRFMAIWGSNPFDELTPATRQRMERQVAIVAESNAVLSQDSHNILRPDGLEGIEAPVLIMTGGDSPPIMAAIAEALANRLPDVGRAEVPDTGHMLPLTHPKVAADLIALNLERAA